MIAENITSIKNKIPSGVTLVAVSKTKPNEMILEGYSSGHLDFGENKVQELVAKHEALPKNIRWHFIGHLQSNKVKYIAPFVHLVHGVDSLKLLETLNREAAKNKRMINCLLQIKIAQEESKFGLGFDDALRLITSDVFNDLHNIKICGLMGMATFTDDSTVVRKEFSKLKVYFDTLKQDHFNSPDFTVLSMGMSDDYPVAIECGSTMIRVGSSIFGQRIYPAAR